MGFRDVGDAGAEHIRLHANWIASVRRKDGRAIDDAVALIWIANLTYRNCSCLMKTKLASFVIVMWAVIKMFIYLHASV